MNSENSKTSQLRVLILKLTNKLDLRIGERIITLSNLSIYYTWKNIKSSYNNNKLKMSAPPYILYQIFNILKKHGENADKPSVQMYVNKIENSVTFKLKNGYSLELLTPETMK